MKKNILLIVMALFVGVFAYWVKCQQSIDLFETVSFRDAPFSRLLRNSNPHNIVYADEKKVILFADDFETAQSKKNWTGFWMRERGDIIKKYEVNKDKDSRCLLIENRGEKNWSLRHNELIPVSYGDIFSFSADVKRTDDSIGVLSVMLYKQGEQKPEVKQWHFARKAAPSVNKWVSVENQFMVPAGVSHIQFRLTGSGRGKVWFDNVVFRKEGVLEGMEPFKEGYLIENEKLSYSLDLADKVIMVTDKRTNKSWLDENTLKQFQITKIEEPASGQLNLKIVNPLSLQVFEFAIRLVKEEAEVICELSGDPNEAFYRADFPFLFEISEDAKIVLPRAQGFLLDRDTARKELPSSMRYKGGFPMPIVGVFEGEAGWMQIAETPLDLELVKDVSGEDMRFKNRWLGQKGTFGYPRSLRLIFFDGGGYVTMAKRYREYATEKGLVKTLQEKNRERDGNIDKLIGAVNVWFWGIGKLDFAREMHNSGIENVLYSNADWDVKGINALGYLTGIYDIYQDVWPRVYREVTRRTEGWPEDLVLDEEGEWIQGWTIKRGLKEYQGGVVCSIRGLERAKKKIPQDLRKNPYTARFIDTTTSTPWRECYSPEHPTTRSEDLSYKMQLLSFVSSGLGLVTGSEDGVAEAVPYVDYFEGMMSPGFARLPGSGRGVSRVEYMEPTENFIKYQVGGKYRIPLWELVFHDCVVSTWYWGDSSNLIPEVWWRRDLFNILYGNMPLWAIRDWDHWREHKKRFIESYNNVSPVFKKVGYKEMISHRFVTEDRTVQETVFEGDIRVVVNFGEETFKIIEHKYNLPAHGFVIFDKGKIWKEGVCS